MAATITRDILESYLNCRYKAHLKLRGEPEITPDYEKMLSASRKRLKQIATDKILARHPATDVPTEIPLNFATLRDGSPMASRTLRYGSDVHGLLPMRRVFRALYGVRNGSRLTMKTGKTDLLPTTWRIVKPLGG